MLSKKIICFISNLSQAHTSPHAHLVIQHSTSHISPRFMTDKELARAMMAGFTAALGQARLRYGNTVR